MHASLGFHYPWIWEISAMPIWETQEEALKMIWPCTMNRLSLHKTSLDTQINFLPRGQISFGLQSHTSVNVVSSSNANSACVTTIVPLSPMNSAINHDHFSVLWRNQSFLFSFQTAQPLACSENVTKLFYRSKVSKTYKTYNNIMKLKFTTWK